MMKMINRELLKTMITSSHLHLLHYPSLPFQLLLIFHLVSAHLNSSIHLCFLLQMYVTINLTSIVSFYFFFGYMFCNSNVNTNCGFFLFFFMLVFRFLHLTQQLSLVLPRARAWTRWTVQLRRRKIETTLNSLSRTKQDNCLSFNLPQTCPKW